MNDSTGKKKALKIERTGKVKKSGKAKTVASTVKTATSDMDHVVLVFEDNRQANVVFGQFDENLARIEQKLGLDIRAQGNEVSISGNKQDIEVARQALDQLYELAKTGLQPGLPDVDGAIALAATSDARTDRESPEKDPPNVTPAHISTRKKTIDARTPTQDAYMRALQRAELVFGVGPAGTGKTYLAVAHAAMLLERGLVERIILSRPAVEAGERLGFLPGDMKEKVDPYLRPLYDALYDMMPAEKIERAMAADIIEIAPLAFMRGRTLAHSAVILDEAQNTTSMQMKMFLTRLGEGSRMIVTGDPSQIDLPFGQKSGLTEAMRILDSIDNIVTVHFSQKDVVRHPLVTAIVTAYDRDARANAKNRALDNNGKKNLSK